jgi:hypothetical protein
MNHRTSRIIAMLALALPLALTACDDDESGGKDLQPFLGTWHVTNGTLTPSNCAITGALPLAGNVEVAKSTTAGVDVVVNVLGCVSNYTTSGKTATIVAGQMCSTMIVVPGIGPVPVQLTPTTGTLVVAADNATATFNGGGKANSPLGMCDYALVAQLAKGAAPDGGSPTVDSGVKNDGGVDASVKTDGSVDSGVDATVRNDAGADASVD